MNSLCSGTFGGRAQAARLPRPPQLHALRASRGAGNSGPVRVGRPGRPEGGLFLRTCTKCVNHQHSLSVFFFTAVDSERRRSTEAISSESRIAPAIYVHTHVGRGVRLARFFRCPIWGGLMKFARHSYAKYSVLFSGGLFIGCR